MQGAGPKAVKLLAPIAGVVGVTYVAASLVPVNAATAGFGYLLVVLIAASFGGFVESLVASLLATSAFNYYFLPPVGTFTIADPHNWIALFSFLATALIASRLATEAEHRTLEAVRRQEDIERLYSFSRAILLVNGPDPLPKQLAHKLAETFHFQSVVLYDRRNDELYCAGPLEFDAMEGQLREAALQGASFQDAKKRRVITAVRLGSQPIASLGLQGEAMPDSVLQGIANLIAIGLERARAQGLAAEVEAARQAELLRTALIDAMAHEFKTPLTSIRAATTSLLSNPEQDERVRTELLKIADEESEHLQVLIDDAVEMARLDVAHIDIRAESSDLAETAREVIGALRTAIDGRAVMVDSPPQLPQISFDRRLIKLAIKQILDNALKYSPATKPVQVRLRSADRNVSLEIIDQGQGIPPADQEKIFQRFYRSPSVIEGTPGSGLGLSIASRIVNAHGGKLTVSSRPGETIFQITLPIDEKVESK